MQHGRHHSFPGPAEAFRSRHLPRAKKVDQISIQVLEDGLKRVIHSDQRLILERERRRIEFRTLHQGAGHTIEPEPLNIVGWQLGHDAQETEPAPIGKQSIRLPELTRQVERGVDQHLIKNMVVGRGVSNIVFALGLWPGELKQRTQGEEDHLIGSDRLPRMELRHELSLPVGHALKAAIIGHLEMFEIEYDLWKRALAETLYDPCGSLRQYGVEALRIDDGEAMVVVGPHPALIMVFDHGLLLVVRSFCSGLLAIGLRVSAGKPRFRTVGLASRP